MGDEPEVWITGPDDQDPAGSSPPPPRGSGRGAGWPRWVALGAGFAVLIAVVAVQHYLGGGSTDATPGPTTSSHTPSRTPSDPTTSTSPTTRTSTPVSTTPPQSSPPAAAVDGLGTAIGPCGEQEYVARVGYVSRLPEPVDVTVLTGTHPRRVDLATGTASAPLIDLPGTQGVLGAASDSTGTVLIKQSCTDRMTMTVLRVSRDAHSVDWVSIPSGWQATGSLIGLSGHVWAVVARSGATGGYSRAELLATDGTGRTMTMPQGLVPTAGWKTYVVGTFGGSGSGLAVYDTARGDTLTHVTDEVDRFIVGDGAVFWTGRCDKSCPIHRFDLVSGKDTVVARTTAPGGPARWRAVSPDGDRIVQTSLEPTGPAGYTLHVMDLSTGTVTAVPGLQLGSASPSVAFTPDSQWMIVAVPTLIGARILLYDADLQGPYETGVTVAGPQIGSVPLDIVR